MMVSVGAASEASTRVPSARTRRTRSAGTGAGTIRLTKELVVGSIRCCGLSCTLRIAWPVEVGVSREASGANQPKVAAVATWTPKVADTGGPTVTGTETAGMAVDRAGLSGSRYSTAGCGPTRVK